MDQIPCPDGYLLAAKSPLAEGHHALNQYLVRLEEAGWKPAQKELHGIRDKARKLAVWKALLERLAWLRDNSPGSPWFDHLRVLTEQIEKWKLSPNEADMIELLEGHGKLVDYVAPYAPVLHLMPYVQEHGLTPRLSAAIRDFATRVEGIRYRVNQVSHQLFCSRLDMLAWRDEWNDVDLKRCWSERIRADFRAMQGPERENWRRLLHSIKGDEGVRPSPRWASDAAELTQAIGPHAVRAALMRWFEPLQPGQTQRLSRPGSFILRALIWLTQSLNDPDLAAKVRQIPEVQFKPKANGQKVIRAAAESLGQADPTVTAPKPPRSFDAIIAKALAMALSPETSAAIPPEIAQRIWIDGLTVYVRGDLDMYRLHISTGAVFRESDGKKVRVAVENFRQSATAMPDIGGMGDMLGKILILAEDTKHRAALTAIAE